MIDNNGNETKTIYEAHLLAENLRLRKALEYYANETEWHGTPWKLTFNSSHIDGDGFETAKEALAI